MKAGGATRSRRIRVSYKHGEVWVRKEQWMIQGDREPDALHKS